MLGLSTPLVLAVIGCGVCNALCLEANNTLIACSPRVKFCVESHIVVVTESIMYSELHGLLLDLYTPNGTSSGGWPAIVAVHSGGFATGDRSRMKQRCEEFARHGFVCASIDYRLLAPSQGNADEQSCSAIVSWENEGRVPQQRFATDGVETMYGFLVQTLNLAGTNYV